MRSLLLLALTALSSTGLASSHAASQLVPKGQAIPQCAVSIHNPLLMDAAKSSLG